MGYISDLRELVGHRPLIMPCACAILGDGKGNVLLQRRTDDGRWGYHGGAVELFESVEDALRRELREELGVALEAPTLLGIYSSPAFRHVYPNGDEVSAIDIVYVCERWKGDIALQAEEVAEAAWFRRDTLPANMVENHHRPLLDYLERFD